MTLAIINHWVSDNGNETIAKYQLAHTSKRTSVKNLCISVNRNQAASQQNIKNFLKFVPLSAGVVDTGD